jgi:hypothetical protein
MDAIKQAIDLDRLEKLARMVQGEEWQSYRGTSCAPVEASTILRLVRVARAAKALDRLAALPPRMPQGNHVMARVRYSEYADEKKAAWEELRAALAELT